MLKIVPLREEHMGALFFVFYNYIAYIFAMHLNWGFLVHLVNVVLSVYTLVAIVDGKAVQEKLSGTAPERLAGEF